MKQFKTAKQSRTEIAAAVIMAAFIFTFLTGIPRAEIIQKAKNKTAVSNVKYLNQNEKGRSSWCVIYTIAMLLSHYDIKASPKDIAKSLEMDTRKTPYFSWKSTFAEEGSLERYLKETHFLITRKRIFVTMREPLAEWIKKNIAKDRPVILIYGKFDGHAVLLTGYDNRYLYMNDPSGAFFYEASQALKTDMRPGIWLSPDRKSPYEGAGVRWVDFKKFIRMRNLWGYMFVVTEIDEKARKKAETHTLYGPNRGPDFYDILFK